jgi:hypothetical protein
MPRAIFGRGNIQPPTRGIDPLDILGNGRLASVEAASQVAQYLNQISACRRKILAQWSLRPGDMSGVSGTTAWATIQYFRIRPSYQMSRVRACIVAIPSSSTDVAATPGLKWIHQENTYGTPGLANIYRSMDIGRRDTGTIVPDDYIVLDQILGPETNTSGTDHIVPGRDFDLYLQGRGGARVISVMIFEEQGKLYIDNPNDTGIGATIDITDVSPYGSLTVPAAQRNGDFNNSDVGGQLVITDATDGANSGSFWIHLVDDEETLEYGNASAATEAFAAGTRYRIRSPSVRAPRTGSPITDDDIERFFQIPYEIWKNGGGHLFEWANELTAVTRTSATYANVHDQTVTAWASNSQGYWAWPHKQGSYELARVPVVMWAQAQMGAGTGGVRFLVNGRTVGTCSVSTTKTVTTTTGYLDSDQTDQKVDVHIAGTGAAAVNVYSFGMYQYST